jgi:hypothetical protein
MLERLFQGHLEEDEILHLVVHKHWLFFVRAFFLPGGALIAITFFLIASPGMSTFALVLLADVAIAVWFLRSFFDEFLDAWLVTDRSVIDIAWHGWFHRTSTRIDYSSIEGVSTEVQGILGTLLHFGTLTIEKVGSGAKVSMENVPHSRTVESAILFRQEQCLRSKNLKDSKAVQDLLAEIVAERMNLQGVAKKKIQKSEKNLQFKTRSI